MGRVRVIKTAKKVFERVDQALEIADKIDQFGLKSIPYNPVAPATGLDLESFNQAARKLYESLPRDPAVESYSNPPTIIRNPTTYYNTTNKYVSDLRVINVDYRAKLPKMPPRRLPPPGESTATERRKAVSVTESATNRIYGKLLHSPLDNRETVLLEGSSMTFWDATEVEQQNAEAQYNLWAKSNYSLYPIDFTFWDTGLLAFPYVSKSLDLFFGSRFPIELANEFKRRSLGSLKGSRCTIPTNVKVAEPKLNPTVTLSPVESRLDVSTGTDPETQEKVEDLSKIIGKSSFPGTLPEYLTDDSNKEVEVNSLADLMVYTVKQLDALCGQFPIKIKIKDTDIEKEGDQSAEVNLPNIAEALGEIFGLAYTATTNSDTLINIGVRTMTQAANATVAALVAQDHARNCADYLGFEEKEEKEELQLAFNPKEEGSLASILQSSKHEYVSYKNVDERNLQTTLITLLEAAAIIKAVHWRKIDLSGDVKKQIMDNIKAHDTSKDLKGAPLTDKDDMDEFLDEAERGFINSTGITDSINPYGRNYSDRPRIRLLGNTSDIDNGK